MASKKLSYEALREQYAALWGSMEPRASKAADVEATAKKIIAKKARYGAVEKATGVPWYVVGVIHAMEANCDFACHLHNGDPLTAPTVNVPKNRPPKGIAPFAWKDSAIDALKMHELEKVEEWSIERICFELERYNGFGYRSYHSDVLSPYLWSGTNHYARGKYVADGTWSATTVSGQSGAVAILKRITELDASVVLVLSTDTPVLAPADIEEKVATPAEAFPRATPPSPVKETIRASRTIFTTLCAAGSFLAYVYNEAIEIALAAATQFDALAPLGKLLAAMGVSVAGIALVSAFVALAGPIFARLDAAAKGKIG